MAHSIAASSVRQGTVAHIIRPTATLIGRAIKTNQRKAETGKEKTMNIAGMKNQAPEMKYIITVMMIAINAIGMTTINITVHPKMVAMLYIMNPTNHMGNNIKAIGRVIKFHVTQSGQVIKVTGKIIIFNIQLIGGSINQLKG